MRKPAILAFALTILFAAGALAADPPSSVEDCLKTAIELAEASETLPPEDETRSRIERHLITLESHCEAKRFSEDANLITDIQTALEGS